MPRVPSTTTLALDVRARALLREHPVHDVWQVELPATAVRCTVPALLDRIRAHRGRGVPWIVRGLFGLRAAVGAVLRLDRDVPDAIGDRRVAALARTVPDALRNASRVVPGTPEGPFVTLYLDDREAVYAAVNATVDARLLVVIDAAGDGTRLTWATYVRPVGRITPVYLALIEPFRRLLVYPGLERWLQRTWHAASPDPGDPGGG